MRTNEVYDCEEGGGTEAAMESRLGPIGIVPRAFLLLIVLFTLNYVIAEASRIEVQGSSIHADVGALVASRPELVLLC